MGPFSAEVGPPFPLLCPPAAVPKQALTPTSVAMDIAVCNISLDLLCRTPPFVIRPPPASVPNQRRGWVASCRPSLLAN